MAHKLTLNKLKKLSSFFLSCITEILILNLILIGPFKEKQVIHMDNSHDKFYGNYFHFWNSYFQSFLTYLKPLDLTSSFIWFISQFILKPARNEVTKSRQHLL